jgi:hypothetical protein
MISCHKTRLKQSKPAGASSRSSKSNIHQSINQSSEASCDFAACCSSSEAQTDTTGRNWRQSACPPEDISMSVFASVLFWFVTVTTCMSGFGFLFKIPNLYHPNAYIVNDAPGTGQTGFEKIATFVFACVYLAPIAGVVYGYFIGSNAALRSACIAPMLYHVMSFFGVYFVFGEYLNPEMTTIHGAAAMHGVYAVLFGVLFWTATGEEDSSSSGYKGD